MQGCGKSLCAKAIAAEWKLPLIRLDPSNLYNRYVGESEKNLKRAIKLAEKMAPVVLWIDEIEKSLSQEDAEGGPAQRIFGTFLAWLQDKKEDVFVIATANDISKLPPELMRKGSFRRDFLRRPPRCGGAQREFFKIHLKKRKRNPDDFSTSPDLVDAHGGLQRRRARASGRVRALYSLLPRRKI